MIGFVIGWIVNIFILLLFVNALLSWIRIDPYSQPTFYKIKLALNNFFEPFLAPIRNIMPQTGGIDLSPMILVFALILIRNILGSIF